MERHNYLSSSYARILFRHLRLSEADSPAYFAGTDISYDELMTLDGTISRGDLLQIYRNARAIAGRDDLGLSVGTQLHVSTHGPLGVAIFSSPDLRHALDLLARYSPTRLDLVRFAVTEHADGISLRLSETCELADLREFVTEGVLSSIFGAINHFTGDIEFGGKVRFAYAKPGYGDQYPAHFGRDITFNQSATEVFIPDALLSIASPVADSVMYEQSVAICEQQLKEIEGNDVDQPIGSTEKKVSALIMENPGKIWSLKEVADKLHMSSRTLIRKLASEGTQFQLVRDEVAKIQAIRYLSDPNLTVESVGHLMGFSDVSSFRRSFKRWFGETPSQYMKNHEA